MREMHPHLVVATLILFLETQRAVRDGERTVHPYLPLILGLWRLDKSTHIGPFTRHSTRSHNGVGPGGTGRIVLAKASSIMLVSRRSLPHERCQAAPLKSPATISTCSSGITGRTVSNNFFPMPRFLANLLLMCNDIMLKKDLPLRGCRRNDCTEDDSL